MKNTLFFLLFLSLAIGCWSDVVSLAPTDDMYTDPDHPGVTPSITELWTADYSTSGHFERIMIKFDLSAYSEETVDSAILHLTRFFSCPSTGSTSTTFYPITESWDENGWDYTQNIQYNSDISMPYVFSGAGGNAIVSFEIDVTDLINQFLDGSLENNGLLIKANSNQKFSKFYSKEFANSNYQPSLELSLAGVDADINQIPDRIVLNQNYPNPFNPNTTISFSLPANENGKLSIFNSKGQVIKTYKLDSSNIKHEDSVIWNGMDAYNQSVPSGLYFYKIETGNQYTSARKMILLK